MSTEPKDALQRERGLLPVEGSQGSIMNVEVLQQTREIVQTTMNRLKDKFRFFFVDTSSKKFNSAEKACVAVADQVLNWIEEQLQEDILSIPKDRVITIFHGSECLASNEARSVVDAFSQHGEYRPRVEVEGDTNRVQALPVVVVRNRSGEVLRLRRKEKREENALHQKIVIWAGGHVRKEDAQNGNSLLQSAVRELQEELRISIGAETLKLLGTVYADRGGSTSKHVAIVYEWRAETDDVSVALSSAEFFERQGTSLSGTFVGLDDLVKDLEAGKLPEAWSEQIVRHLLTSDRNYTRTLFEA